MTNQIKDASPLIILQNQIALLKMKTRNCLQISIAGGIFNITPELISHVQIYLGNGYSNAVFLDKNNNPIMIKDLLAFNKRMLEREIEVLNEYYVEFEKLKQLKSPVEWLEDE